ncbi:hypothetical protein BBJ28_00020042, partial [Nothophytophthora sp. Chile5]
QPASVGAEPGGTERRHENDQQQDRQGGVEIKEYIGEEATMSQRSATSARETRRQTRLSTKTAAAAAPSTPRRRGAKQKRPARRVQKVPLGDNGEAVLATASILVPGGGAAASAQDGGDDGDDDGGDDDDDDDDDEWGGHGDGGQGDNSGAAGAQPPHNSGGADQPPTPATALAPLLTKEDRVANQKRFEEQRRQRQNQNSNLYRKKDPPTDATGKRLEDVEAPALRPEEDVNTGRACSTVVAVSHGRQKQRHSRGQQLDDESVVRESKKPRKQSEESAVGVSVTEKTKTVQKTAVSKEGETLAVETDTNNEQELHVCALRTEERAGATAISGDTADEVQEAPEGSAEVTSSGWECQPGKEQTETQPRSATIRSTQEGKTAEEEDKATSASPDVVVASSEVTASKPEKPRAGMVAVKASKYEERRWNAEALRTERANSNSGVGELLEKEMRKRNVRRAKVLLATARQIANEKRTLAAADEEYQEGLTWGERAVKAMAKMAMRKDAILKGAQHELAAATTPAARRELSDEAEATLARVLVVTGPGVPRRQEVEAYVERQLAMSRASRRREKRIWKHHAKETRDRENQKMLRRMK